MKKNEKIYVIIFDKHKKFKEIRMLSESSDPFVVNPKSVGDSIYIYTQKEFAKFIESAMRYLTEPVCKANNIFPFPNIGQEIILPCSAMPTETATTDSTKNIKKAPEEYRSDGKAACTLTGGVDINPKIEINGTEVSKKIFDDFLKAGSK